MVSTKNNTKKAAPKKTGIKILIAGAIILIAGLIFALVKILGGEELADAEFLVEVGTWTREDASSVIWQFTDIGEGSLTTNAHQNDYDFIWAISGDKLKIETEWLYKLNDEFNYILDKTARKLILDEEIVLVPAE